MQNIVNTSTDLSIIVQVITGIIGIDGIFKKIPLIHQILQSVLGLELFVQFVELLFYIIYIRLSPLKDMASIRYFDWVITTPTMLITTITYFTYEQYLEKYESSKNTDEKNIYKEKLEQLKFFDFIKKNKENIITIVVCNFFMLLFGYLGEIGYSDLLSSSLFGFGFFFMTFYVIYDKYAKFSKIGVKMFKFLAFIWGMYGFAFLLNPTYKNISFNTLDIFAKNFFGIYLYFKILQK